MMKISENVTKNLVSLRVLFPVIIVVFTLFLILVFGYTTYRVSRNALTSSVLESFTKDAYLVKTQVLSSLDHEVQTLQVLKNTPPI